MDSKKDKSEKVAGFEARGELTIDARENLIRSLRGAGFDEAKVQEWVRLVETEMPDLPKDEIVAFTKAGELGAAPVSPTRRQLTIWRHSLSHWWNHGKGVSRLIYASAWGTLLYQTVTKSALGLVGWVIGLVVLYMKLRVVIGEMDPKHLPMFQRTLDERQLLLKKLLHSMQLWGEQAPTVRELENFEVDCLRLIVSLVRDHRSDLHGKKIFANLMVERGDSVLVIARADDNRDVPKAYAREQVSIACSAFETGLPKMTGDVYADAPNTERGKSYSSVLAIPVKIRNQVLAVVSIDSELKYHFYNYFDELENLLGPYIQILASALLADHDNSRVLD